MDYSEKLKDPRWQKIRLKIFERDDWCCQLCFDRDSTLTVHHHQYNGKDPWDTPLDMMVTLCEPCHGYEYESGKISNDRLSLAVKGKSFFTYQVNEIADGFEALWHGHSLPMPPYFSTIIKYFLSNRTAFEAVAAMYFESIKKHE